jgi:hypothetical protein
MKFFTVGLPGCPHFAFGAPQREDHGAARHATFPIFGFHGTGARR